MRLVPGSPWLRGLALGCISVIVILSLIPGRWQERTSLPGPLEHFGAYLITAVIIGLAARRRHNPIFLVAGLSLVSAVLEILQYWSPGRDPQFVGFFGSVTGALVGGLLANRIRTD
jgi:VanZ family protein